MDMVTNRAIVRDALTYVTDKTEKLKLVSESESESESKDLKNPIMVRKKS